MARYTPYQEPQTSEIETIVRRVWEELRRIETAINDLEARVSALEP